MQPLTLVGAWNLLVKELRGPIYMSKIQGHLETHDTLTEWYSGPNLAIALHRVLFNG